MANFIKIVGLLISAASGFKKLYDIVKQKIMATVRKEAIDKAVNEKDTSDIEHIVNTK
jgi:hypothetical protein